MTMKSLRKLSALVLSGAMALSLAACSTSDAGSSPAPSGSAAAEAQTYTASAAGFGGDVTVTLTVTGTTVDALSVEGPDETESVGGAAITDFNDTLAGYVGKDVSEVTGVDAVSGATVTSTAVQTALEDVLSQVAG